MKTFRIYVTQDDINSGCPREGHNCAIARAMSRVFDGLEILVSSTGIFFRKTLDHKILCEVMLPCPYDCVDFIELYDTKSVPSGIGKSLVQPFDFELSMSDNAYEQLTGKEYTQLGMFDAFDSHSSGIQEPTVATPVTELQPNQT